MRKYKRMKNYIKMRKKRIPMMTISLASEEI